MARVTLNPNVADFFVRMDWHDARNDEQGFGDEVMRHYEDGKIILMANAPLQIDFALLNKLTLPEGKPTQKLSETKIASPRLYRRREAQLFFQNFAQRPLFWLRLRKEVQHVSDQVRSFTHTLFHRYRTTKESVSWRFTRTGPETMHVDFFRPQNVDYLRMFVNIDQEPRVWTVTHQLEELIARNYESAALAELRDAPSCDVCQRITDKVLSPLTMLPPAESDRHVIEFEQGDVWLCETRINSHQIWKGRRMIATDFYVDPTSLLDPSLRVNERIRRCFERQSPSASGTSGAAAAA